MKIEWCLYVCLAVINLKTTDKQNWLCWFLYRDGQYIRMKHTCIPVLTWHRIIVMSLHSSFYLFSVYTSDIFKRLTYILSGYRNAFLREKWSENLNIPPRFEDENPWIQGCDVSQFEAPIYRCGVLIHAGKHYNVPNWKLDDLFQKDLYIFKNILNWTFIYHQQLTSRSNLL